MTDDSDLLDLLDDEHSGDETGLEGHAPRVWDLLIVDDDPDVHSATLFALDGVQVLGRPLRFFRANSSEEAIAVLRQHPDMAVILLDVVMESDDAGLVCVGRIRNELGLPKPRIILRTGQPGYAPEMEAIRDYDINDYKTKNELTRNKLYTAVVAAVRSYDQVCRLDASRHGLEQIVRASGALLAEQGLSEFASGVITQISALLGIEQEGLVCAQASLTDPDAGAPEAEQYVVLAAAGRYTSWVRQPLERIDDARIRHALHSALERRETLYENGALTLFFPAQTSAIPELRGDGGRNLTLGAISDPSPGFALFVDTHGMQADLDRGLIDVFASNVAICADNIQLVNRLHEFAFVDRLVKLPNRTAFVQAVDACLVGPEAATHSVALIDIDQFAEINNAFGHAYGDRLLVAVARRLSDGLPPEVRLARLSGDAFGVLGPSEGVNASVLRPLFEQPFQLEDLKHKVAVSIGYVRLADTGPNGNAALKDAAIARKLAKAEGVDHDVVFSPQIGVEARERTRLLHELRRAFDRERLFPMFQPQIDIATGRLIGVEALMRWRDDNGQFVPPDRFIPLAEQSGLILLLGSWILRTSLQFLGQWRRQIASPELQTMRVAVNVSAVQFRQSGLSEIVDEALQLAGLEPDALELEVTESVAMMGHAEVAVSLDQLRKRGIMLAIDDFGTGFSSLSYLDRLPVDRLKIDRSFVRKLENEGGFDNQSEKRLVDLIIQMGHRLGLRVIAEGVETEAQLELLREMGCHEVQGYYYARPMVADDLAAWIRARGR